MGGRIYPNEEFWPKAVLTHAPAASATAHGMTDKNVHASQCTLKLSEFEQDVGEGVALRRFSMSRLIHGIAIKTSGGERFAETKHILLRAGASMSEERNGMRARRCGEKSKRGCVCRQHYFLNANARVNHV